LLDINFDFTSGNNSKTANGNIDKDLFGGSGLLGYEDNNMHINIRSKTADSQDNNINLNDRIFTNDEINNVNNSKDILNNKNLTGEINIIYNTPQPNNINIGKTNEDPFNFKEGLSPGFNHQKLDEKVDTNANNSKKDPFDFLNNMI